MRTVRGGRPRLGRYDRPRPQQPGSIPDERIVAQGLVRDVGADERLRRQGGSLRGRAARRCSGVSVVCGRTGVGDGGIGPQASNRWAMVDNQLRDVDGAPRPRGMRGRLVCGLGQSLGGNATAFGYSVTITASFGAVELGRGSPRFGDLIVFGLGAVVAFGGLEGVATGGFRSPLEKGSDDVILLGFALAFVSIVLAIATARGLAAVLSGRVGVVWRGVRCLAGVRVG